MAKWRIKRGEKIAGEVSSSKVRQLAAAGKLRKTDLLCKQGTEKWVLAGNVKGLWKTKPPSQSQATLADDQKSSPSSQVPAHSAAQVASVEGQGSLPPPQPQATEPAPQQAANETPLREKAIETPAMQEPTAPVLQQEASEQLPKEEVSATPLQEETTETPPQEEAIKPLPQEEANEAHLGQEAFVSDQEIIEDPVDPDIETYDEPSDEYLEEPYDDEPYDDEPYDDETYDVETYDDETRAPRRKWLMPLIVGGIGSVLFLGLLSMFMRGERPKVTSPNSVAMPEQQSETTQQRRSSSNSNLSLTQHFFQPNITQNTEYTTKKFENNTTVAVYSKTTVEKWDTDSALYYHEKGFRNFGQTVAYRVSNGYVQLKAGENWFRFLKVGAKVGDKWTPGDGEDGTVDWTGNGEFELFDFKTVDSTPVAIIEFTAKPEHSVPSFLVPAAFDFGLFVTDDSGPIEGKIRFELGQGLGILRADAIVPKGTRHKSGGGRDTADWIFATMVRNTADQNAVGEQPANEGL
jgi:hypothetical protein